MKKIAIITTQWNTDFVGPCLEGCTSRLAELGVTSENIDIISVPGVVETPLTAKILAKTGKYSAVIAIGFVYGGGIYRHEFVAQAVLDQIVRLSSELEIPILSSVLTPVDIDMKKAEDVSFYAQHMLGKGREVANACMNTIASLESIQ